MNKEEINKATEVLDDFRDYCHKIGIGTFNLFVLSSQIDDYLESLTFRGEEQYKINE